MAKLFGLRALVTGAGSGIGLAVCRRFLAEGATVVAVDVTLTGLAPIAAHEPERLIPCHCDVADPVAVEAAIQLCRERMGGLDILFNNAGIGRGGVRLHEVTLKDWDDVISVNLRGQFLVLKYGLPLMIDSGGGAIVNTASTASFKAGAKTGAYAPSKAGVAQLTAVAALEYAADGVRINAIAPGPTETPLLQTVPAEHREAMANALPLGRMGTVEEVANVVTFLVSKEASFVTGTTYAVDGGHLIE